MFDATATLLNSKNLFTPHLANPTNLLVQPLSHKTSFKPKMTLSHYKLTNTEGQSQHETKNKTL